MMTCHQQNKASGRKHDGHQKVCKRYCTALPLTGSYSMSQGQKPGQLRYDFQTQYGGTLDLKLQKKLKSD